MGVCAGPAQAPVSDLPKYEASHPSCSVLVGRIRNGEHLASLEPSVQFRWLHRFYLMLDRIVQQHQVYKLFGGPQGFVISAAVAEPDEHHAAALLRFALHLHVAAQKIHLPGMVPLDLCVALASGEAASGLLGKLSLSYQIVGPCMEEAQLLADTQAEVPLLIAGSMLKELPAEAATGLMHLGRVQLQGRCAGEDEVPVHSLPRYAHMKLTGVAAPKSAH